MRLPHDWSFPDNETLRCVATYDILKTVLVACGRHETPVAGLDIGKGLGAGSPASQDAARAAI